MHKLLAIDGMNWLSRAYHAVPPAKTKAGIPTNAVQGLVGMLAKADREHAPTHICVVFDAPGPTFRHELFAAYKATRPAKPEDYLAQIPLAHEAAAAYGCTVYSVPGVEADDVIARLARGASKAGLQVVIGSSDKDLLQLCSDQVRILDAKGALIGPAEVVEKWGVPPHQLVDVLALMGDSGDNVPGIDGIGPKTAADLVNTWGTLEGVLANAGKIPGKKGQAIVAGAKAATLAKQLVTLRDDVTLPHPPHPVRRNPQALRELCGRLEFAVPVMPEQPAAPQPPVAAPPPVVATAPASISFAARLGDLVTWDADHCAVLVVHSSGGIAGELRGRLGAKVKVTLEAAE